MRHLEIHLKNGAVITVDATEAKAARSTRGFGYTNLEWTTPKGFKRRLISIEPAEIVALVEIT